MLASHNRSESKKQAHKKTAMLASTEMKQGEWGTQ